MSERNEVPASACQFGGGEKVKFTPVGDGVSTTPIRMLLRSAEPIDHWWWGRVVHDMAGMKLHKDRVPVDYVHDEPIGYLDKFDASDKGLWVEGELVATDEPGDRVRRLTKLSDAGVPYEASLDFGGDGIKIEWLGEDQVAQVNGYQFEGPGAIIREWPMRGGAVCPYGADMYTKSKFARGVEEKFTLTNMEGDMPKDPKKLNDGAAATETKLEAKPAAAAEAKSEEKPADTASEEKPAESTPAEAPAETPAPAAELSKDRVECKRFVDSFGPEGGVWFSQGMSFEQAQVKFTQQLGEQVKKLAKENNELQKKLGNVGKQGELTPVGADPSDEKKKTGFAGKLESLRRA